MRVLSWAGVTTVCLLLCGGAISAEEQQCLRRQLPSNVEFTAGLAQVVQRIYDRSPTFRAQCERIGAAAHLSVVVRINTSIPGWCRAYTIISRRGWDIHASVHLPPGAHLVEMVAHEFEHIIEQIEGHNLRKLARVRGSGVREVDRNLFETDRAQAAGLVVADEARTAKLPAAD
jgi:hypothetical protein